MLVRNQRLYAHSFTTAEQRTALTVPPDTVALIKAVHYSNRSAGALTIQVVVQAADGAVVYLINQSISTSGATGQLQTWFAMNPGDVLYVSSSAGGLDVWISGALLPGQLAQGLAPLPATTTAH